MAKGRSTNFPSIDLGVALDLAGKIWEQAERHRVPAKTVVEDYWGYSLSGSSGRQRLGAVRAFDLIETSGSGEDRQVRITEEAAKILTGHPEKQELLKRCALAPRAHRLIWDELADNGSLPPDDTIRHYLMFNFTPPFSRSGADRLVSEFRQTVEASGLTDREASSDSGSGMHGESGGGASNSEVRGNSPGGGIPSAEDGGEQGDLSEEESKGAKRPKPSIGRRQDVFSVDEGEIVVEWPSQLSKHSVDDIEAWFRIITNKMKRAAGASTAENHQGETEN